MIDQALRQYRGTRARAREMGISSVYVWMLPSRARHDERDGRSD